MKSSRKRAWASGLVALAVSTVVPLLTPQTASAAGVLQGAASVRSAGGAATLNTGNSDTAFTLRLPTNASCAGDSANDGYRVQSYMVPASVDPATLQFDADGPTPAGIGASFRQPLYDTTFSPYVNAQTAPADLPPGPGAIINIPNFNFAAFAPGNIPAGAYNIGIACTLGPTSATQMKEFWNVPVTFTTDAATGGTAQVSWGVGLVDAAPVLDTVTVGDTTLTANFTPTSPSNPGATTYTVTAVPTAGATVTATGAGSPITVPGLVNGTSYSLTVTGTNPAGTTPASNAISATPINAPRPAVTGLTATPGAPGSGTIDLSWTAPSGVAPTGYTVAVSPNEGNAPVITGTTASVTGLTAGTTYTFTVTPTHPAPFVGLPASVQGSVNSAQVLVQDLEVTRPVGALVLTQVCGTNGDIPAETAGQTLGFPALAAVPADDAGTGPFLGWNGGTFPGSGTVQDPAIGQYPYPVDANEVPNPVYPTHCGVSLGIAKLVTSGPAAGQFFRADGILNRVTVVDTRDTDTGWTVNGLMSTFSAGPGKSFSGSQLGWTPVNSAVDGDTPPFTDSLGNTYDQDVLAGPNVAPNTPNATGLGSGRVLGDANAGVGLGIGKLDARLKLLIPITAKSGQYTGTLTITAVGVGTP